ncbi:MAG: phenylalanine--tRNA ligase subunit alpha [Chitinophagaceae bacterium]|nr:phenylalanine--tRNA ligase subunit alpha [Oligoflexus sp.]
MSQLDGCLKQIEEIRSQFDADSVSSKAQLTTKAVEDLRIKYLGRKGLVTSLMESLKSLSKEEKPAAGKVINELRQLVDAGLESLKQEADASALDASLSQYKLDISLPTQSLQGSLHPVTLMRRKMLTEFRKLGFTVYDGPEIDLDFYNFEALNFKDDHPARDMQDTFFVADRVATILRTHTSNIQIHAMMHEKVPLRVVAPGRTYRCDSDITHTPMFHQIEGFVVDKNISMGDMKGIVDLFLKAIFGNDLSIRLRPSFFPFVEPGAEFDLQCVSCRGKGCRICKETGWLEIGGLGMIHPNVFEKLGMDSEEYTGFAFGFGIDRIAMLRYGLADLRQLFEGDQQFLGQFPIHP